MTSKPRKDFYPYDDLQSGNWTRVLHLDSAESTSDPLTGRLQSGDLRIPPPKLSTGSQPPTDKDPLPKFDALSWCWGTGDATETLRLEQNGRAFKMLIPPTLADALRALRLEDKVRALWVDAICVNMKNAKERAHQVAQMNLVYSRAGSVCVWLENDPPVGRKYGCTTKEVFTFIEEELLDISSFDRVVATEANASLLASVVQLMTRPWFSRRWVIQEIALTRKATIHCGAASMKWQNFAHAISLFVKAEMSDHQLSKLVIRKDILKNKQGVFWDVQRMGAVSLVEITDSNFFRPAKSSSKSLPQPTATLESLMAMLPMFVASKGRDVIFALLAIAKDTTPEAEGSGEDGLDLDILYHHVNKFPEAEQREKIEVAQKVAAMLAAGLRSKRYTVSYTQPTIDVYKNFIEFCIYQSRSLDVICRPWAQYPDPQRDAPVGAVTEEKETKPVSSPSSSESEDTDSETDEYEPAPQVFLENMRKEFGSARMLTQPLHGSDRNTVFSDSDADALNGTDEPTYHVRQTRRHRYLTSNDKEMPSWISDRKNLAFTLSEDEVHRMERKNGDPLVGLPDNKPYKASNGRQVRMGQVKFLRRSEYDQSLIVEGFVLGEVAKTEAPGSLGNIPAGWLTFTKPDTGPNKGPSLELYRTLIADRGPDGGKAPLYYRPAYYEIMKDTTKAIDIKEKIGEGKSIVTEFLQRVRQVTFNRQLIKVVTHVKSEVKRPKQILGLAPERTLNGDLVCILYGLSVPVILRRNPHKTQEEKDADAIAQAEQLPSATRKAVRTIERYWKFWQDMKIAVMCTKTPWTRYEDKRQDWGNSIRAQFSKYWLDKVEADWHAAQEAKRREAALINASEADTDTSEPNIWQSQGGEVPFVDASPHQHDIPAARLLQFPEKPVHDENERQKWEMEKDKQKWDAMCDQWKTWLDNGVDYPLKNGNYTDRPIQASQNSPEEYYRLIGEAYVDQMMDGEALTYKGEQEIKDQVFELR